MTTKAAKAAWDAHTDRVDDDPLLLAEDDALNVLAETPCASPAEFLKKLRYRLKVESERHGGIVYNIARYGSIIAAVDTHFGIEETA
jgi:hypothetical protein